MLGAGDGSCVVGGRGAVARAGESEGEKVVSPVDCRYEAATQASAAEGPGSTVSIPFPDGDIFRPLFADPKQPQTFATLQAVKARTRRPRPRWDRSASEKTSDSIRADRGVTGGRWGFWPVSFLNLT